jgi:hypothetical protein
MDEEKQFINRIHALLDIVQYGDRDQFRGKELDTWNSFMEECKKFPQWMLLGQVYFINKAGEFLQAIANTPPKVVK